jgi:signal transduction histidine kinase
MVFSKRRMVSMHMDKWTTTFFFIAALMASAAFCIPLFIFSGAFGGQYEDGAFNGFAEFTGRQLHGIVDQDYRLLEYLSRHPAVVSAEAAPEEAAAELGRVHAYIGGFQEIFILDDEGNLLISTAEEYSLWKTMNLHFKRGSPTITVVPASDSHPPQFFLTVPVAEGSNILAAVPEMNVYHRILKSGSTGLAGHVYLLDGKGTVLASTDEEARRDPFLYNGTLSEHGRLQASVIDLHDGKTLFYKPIDGRVGGMSIDWGISLVQVRERLSSQLKRLLIFSGVAAVFVFVLAALFSLLVKRRQKDLFEETLSVTQQLGDGDTSVQFPNSDRKEPGPLEKSLRHICDRMIEFQNTIREMEEDSGHSFNALERRFNEQLSELMDINAQLRHAMGVRKYVEGDLLQAKSFAESANAAKSEFLANMSHELRTPLTHIIGFTDLVVDESFGPLNEMQIEYLTDVLESSKHLLSLINDILDLSKVEAGKMDLEKTDVDLRLLLENSMVMIKEKALKHSLGLETEFEDLPPTIRADERKVRQIVYNLLANAVKFTPEGGTITIKAAPVDPDMLSDFESVNGAVLISVADTGIGISSEDLDRVFNPFEQLDGRTNRKAQGTGLGLALTSRMVSLHGGKIWAESDGEGRGSTFRFILPV